MEVDVFSLASEFPNDNPALHHGAIWVCLEPTAPAQPCRVEREGPSLAEPDERGSEPVTELAPTVRLDEPPTERTCSAELASDEPLPPTVVVAAAVEELELDDEDGAAIVVEELDPVEVSVEGADDPSFEPRDVDPPDESGVVLTCERAEIAEPAASEVVLAEPEPEPEAGVAPVFESIPPDESAAARIDSSALPPAPDDPFTVLVCTLADVAIQAGSPRVAAILPGLLFDGRLPEPLDADLADALRDAGLLDGSGVAKSFVETASAWRAILRGTSDDFAACGAAMLDEWASDLLARMLCAPASAPTLRKELRTRGVAAFGLVEVAA